MLDVEHGHLVKVCGLRTVEAARAATLAGADALGFILAQSRRQVAASLVREVRASLAADAEAMPALVGVTVNATAEELRSLAEQGTLDYVQLSGDESPDVLDDLEVPAIKTIHVAPGMDASSLERQVDRWLDHPRPVVAILIDAKVDGAYGGSGVRADWTVAARIAERYPAFLAGGLKPGNVFEGIQQVQPRGVDVSSGVEIAGEKDLTLIEAFVAHARQGFTSLTDAQVDR